MVDKRILFLGALTLVVTVTSLKILNKRNRVKKTSIELEVEERQKMARNLVNAYRKLLSKNPNPNSNSNSPTNFWWFW